MPDQRAQPGRVVLCLATFAALAGCGGSDSLYAVRGKVVQKDGKPLPGGWIVFQPVEKDKGATADSVIAEDGTFELRTSKPGDGVRPGKYKVLITPPSPGEDQPKKVAALVDPDFQSIELTPLEYEVKAQSNEFTITVAPPRKRPPPRDN